MKSLSVILSSAVLLVSLSAHAGNSQQDRMKDCNAQAKTQSLSGDARKSFMKTCLSGQTDTATPKLNSQQMRMKQCNADAKAKALSGDARKSFMRACLKG